MTTCTDRAAVRADIQQWMADLSFSNDTRSSVLRFYAEDWTCDGEEHYEILCELPNDVAAACIWDLVQYDLKQVPLFQNLRLPSSPFFDREMDDTDEGAKVCARCSPALCVHGSMLALTSD